MTKNFLWKIQTNNLDEDSYLWSTRLAQEIGVCELSSDCKSWTASLLARLEMKKKSRNRILYQNYSWLKKCHGKYRLIFLMKIHICEVRCLLKRSAFLRQVFIESQEMNCIIISKIRNGKITKLNTISKSFLTEKFYLKI